MTLSARFPRMVNALPLLGALVVHGVGHGRLWLSSVALLILAAISLWRGKMVHSPAWMVFWGVLGGVAGIGASFVSEVPPGPLPQGVLSVMCTALIFVSAYCVASGETLYGGTYAWLLAVLSLNGEPNPALYAAVVFMLACTLAQVFARAQVNRSGWLGVALFLGLGVVTPLGAVPVMAIMAEAEGTLTKALYQVFRSFQIPRALGFQSEMSLSPRSSLDASTRPLLDLAGTPGRLRTQVMDIFNGTSWFASNEMRRPLPHLPPATGPTHAVVMTTLEDLSGVLPAPLGTSSVEGASPTVRAGYVLQDSVPRGSVITLVVSKEELPEEPAPPVYMTALPDDS